MLHRLSSSLVHPVGDLKVVTVYARNFNNTYIFATQRSLICYIIFVNLLHYLH